MPLPPSPLSRFARFLRRLAPFWLVWLLILALPAAREPLQLQLLGSELAPRLSPAWREDMRPDRRLDAFALVKAHPRDFNARVWRFSQMQSGRGAGFSEYGTPNTHTYVLADLLLEGESMRRDFPRETWLDTVLLRWQMKDSGDLHGNRITRAQASERVALVRAVGKNEPGNAFYPLLEAGLWRRGRDFGAMWAALHRAAKCPVLETHELEWARAIVRAHELARPLMWEEREAVWRAQLNATSQFFSPWPEYLAHQAREAQIRGDHRRAVDLGVMILSIGDLMQRSPNSIAMAQSGSEWKNSARSLIHRPQPNLPNTPAGWARRRAQTRWAKTFAAYAAAHGRADVVALDKTWSARENRVSTLFENPYSGRTAPASQRDARWRAGFWRDAGGVVGLHLGFVLVCWGFVNLILWRGVGAPSSGRARLVPALFLAPANAGLAWWCWRQIDWLMGAIYSGRAPGTLEHFAFATFSVVLLAFFGAPFLLAISSAGVTLRKHQSEFTRPARIETELQLSRHEATLLKSGPTILCAASLVLTFGFWLVYLGCVAAGVFSIDPFGWLSDIPAIGAVPVEMLLAPVVYLLFADFVALLLWFNKWRYYAGKSSRPLTHGGLRLWKESLGMYLVVGSLIYLGVALIGWPERGAASRELETRMARGELPR